MNQNYQDIREEGLEEADKQGDDFVLDSRNPSDYANKTIDFGRTYREILEGLADNPHEKDAARFIGYEITQEARQSGFDFIDQEGRELEDFWSHVPFGSDFHAFYAGFSIVDRLRAGYRDLIPRELSGEFDRNSANFPNFETLQAKDVMAEYADDAVGEAFKFEPDWFGKYFSKGILVMVDDWISYMDSEKEFSHPNLESESEFPNPNYEYDFDVEEVKDILDELGVGR